MIPTEPYILQNEPFMNKSLEQLIWEAGYIDKEKNTSVYRRRYVSGYKYLDSEIIKKSSDRALVSHAIAVKKAADKKLPRVKCQCCRIYPAIYAEIGSNKSGVTIGPNPAMYLYCERCRKYAADIVSLEFCRINDFTASVERLWYIRTLKFVFLGDEKFKLTKKAAFDFLFGVPQLNLFKNHL